MPANGTADKNKVKKAAAAQAESSGKPKEVSFRDLAFDLPTELPGSAIFVMAEVEEGRKELAPTMKFVRIALGPDQFGQLEDKVSEENLSMTEAGEAIGQLVDDIVALYGMAPGESPASQRS